MRDGSGLLRTRAVASAWFPVLVVVLLAFAAAGGWATMTAHANPETNEQRSEQAHWTVTSEFNHSATVTRENPIFERGAVLTDRRTFFLTASPVLDGSFTAEYASVDASVAALALDAELVVREAGDDVVYWTERTPLDATETTVNSGGERTVSFSVNVSEIAERSAEIQSELGRTPGSIETFVAVSVAAEGTADGDPAALSYTRRLPLSIEGDTYTVDAPGPAAETLTTTETVEVARTYGPLWSLGGPVVLLLAGGGVVALAVGRRRNAFELSEAERRRLTFLQDRATFDEWIIEARLPDAIHDRPRADAESLADLVDFGIDSTIGVVEDPDTGTFYAVSDQMVFVYEPPEPVSPTRPVGSAVEAFVSSVATSDDESQSEQESGKESALETAAKTTEETAAESAMESSNESEMESALETAEKSSGETAEDS